MNRKTRIALELLGPPVIGAGGLTVWAAARLEWAPDGPGRAVASLPVLFAFHVVFAFFCIGLQTLVYTAVMEWRFARGLDPRSWRAVGLSTFLGWASGAVLAVGYGIGRQDTWYLFNGLGPAVGLLLGLIVRNGSKRRDVP